MEEQTMVKAKKAACLSAGLCAAAGLGAGLMYFLDPNRGKARRMYVRDKCSSLYRAGWKEIDHKVADLEHRTKGALAEVKSVLHGNEEVSDPKLEARIRTRLGRAVEHPHSVRVTALDGNVILTGDVTAKEAKRAEAAARLTAGVKSVENLLELTT